MRLCSVRTKRDELLLRMVLALPKASNKGLELKIISFTRATSADLPE